ncbi:hypothetical protein G6F40_015948 [Rhizopus arrhizus]|nr:hypothetical protein G6F40_015948 [Rhizopus arrhizus]
MTCHVFPGTAEPVPFSSDQRRPGHPDLADPCRHAGGQPAHPAGARSAGRVVALGRRSATQSGAEGVGEHRRGVVRQLPMRRAVAASAPRRHRPGAGVLPAQGDVVVPQQSHHHHRHLRVRADL